MSVFALLILMANVVMLFKLPRRWAMLPFLVGVCYIPAASVMQLGPFHFSAVRILIIAGVIRVLKKRERLTGRLNGMDWLLVFWGLWAVFSGLFHKDPSAAVVYRLGLVYDACGIYFLLRAFCQKIEDIEGMCCLLAIILLPVAAEMLYEKITAHNLFSLLGGVSPIPYIRDGKIRANGPFSHAILAGTIGAVCLPMVICLWETQRKKALMGVTACLVMVFSSTSSGPLMSTAASIGALFMWRFRDNMKLVRWMAVFAYIGLDIVMKDPAYFIMARIDLTGSSTGWHRAELIHSAIVHLSEWWLIGTDFTRHWMPTGVTWSAAHTDITNHFLKMGVIGGLPLLLLFAAMLVKGFSYVGQILRWRDLPSESRFMTWALGASLFSHASTFLAVSYFDQSFVFIYLTLAVIGSGISWCNESKATARVDNLSHMNSTR